MVVEEVMGGDSAAGSGTDDGRRATEQILGKERKSLKKGKRRGESRLVRQGQASRVTGC